MSTSMQYQARSKILLLLLPYYWAFSTLPTATPEGLCPVSSMKKVVFYVLCRHKRLSVLNSDTHRIWKKVLPDIDILVSLIFKIWALTFLSPHSALQKDITLANLLQTTANINIHWFRPIGEDGNGHGKSVSNIFEVPTVKRLKVNWHHVAHH